MLNNFISSNDEEKSCELKDKLELLDCMLADSKKQSSLYKPGPYWAKRTVKAVSEIKRCGISEFRGSSNHIGMSFADNLFIDTRNEYNFGFRRLIRVLTRTYPLSKICEAQLQWTVSYANESIAYAQEILNLKGRTRYLLEKYTVPYSLLGKCMRKARIDGHEYSIHYLNLLEQHDNIAKKINFKAARSIFEIGGGFGINVHLLLTNYKNIRKVLYLDIPPNLYIGTQYLKAFHPAAVRDYSSLKSCKEIRFSENDDLEILCVAPWQIEMFKSPVNVFMNSHSFVEMPQSVVKNYVKNFNAFPGAEDAAVALATYDQYDSGKTLAPTDLPIFFNARKFDHYGAETLLDSSRKNLYFVSPGKLYF